MATWYGWAGTILRVNLSEGKIVKQPLTEDLAHSLVGGRGINSKILYDETGPQTEPLAPDNRLIIGTGPMTGTPGPSTGRFTVTAKSPLTGILGDSNGGGDFAPELKFAGYDHIVIEGKAERPVYILIHDDEVEIRDAQHLWGKNTWETEEILVRDLGSRDIRTLSIGQAGEKMVRMACVNSTGDRVPGRTGTGAVMGSKNLKAIVARGTKGVRIARPEQYAAALRKWNEAARQQKMFQVLRNIGTTYLMKAKNESHSLAIKHGDQRYLPQETLESLYGENIVAKYDVKKLGCFGCPILCSSLCVVRDGPYAGEKGIRPEGGSLMGFSIQVGVFDDFPFVLRATNLANQYGLDSISTGTVIALAMKWYENVIINKEDTDGLELEWGNQQVIMELLRKIAYREGFGDILAEGPLKAARKIGRGAEKFVRHAKGMGNNNSRGIDQMGRVLAEATATRGFDHLRGIPSAGAKMPGIDGPEVSPISYDPYWADAVLQTERVCSAADMLEICKFISEWMLHGDNFGVASMAELLTTVTGVDYDEQSLTRASDRLYSLERAYLAREGIGRKDDNPPEDFFDKPLTDGRHQGWRLERSKFEELKDYYYDIHGWDRKTGAPTRETLERLDLGYVAAELERLGVYRESIA